MAESFESVTSFSAALIGGMRGMGGEVLTDNTFPCRMLRKGGGGGGVLPEEREHVAPCHRNFSSHAVVFPLSDNPPPPHTISGYFSTVMPPFGNSLNESPISFPPPEISDLSGETFSRKSNVSKEIRFWRWLELS
ncbi:hypothetical protein CDAR_539191 [Caerostris darwini]|uniref:Uncharacterized protein n=1 Tax=Caerostris darwini TaxID=1538125 RepID=A0AAV4T6M7_9ARAC|nr:hypothetical protein CDAR_539191 [Caerostris darwini]